VDTRAGVDRCGNSRPHRDSIPGPSSRSKSELFRLAIGNDITKFVFRLFNLYIEISPDYGACVPTHVACCKHNTFSNIFTVLLMVFSFNWKYVFYFATCCKIMIMFIKEYYQLTHAYGQ